MNILKKESNTAVTIRRQSSFTPNGLFYFYKNLKRFFIELVLKPAVA